MNFYVMKDVSDMLEFVILKRGPQVCNFISVYEGVFDLYFMSVVVVETIVSNFVICKNVAYSFIYVIKSSVKRM